MKRVSHCAVPLFALALPICLVAQDRPVTPNTSEAAAAAWNVVKDATGPDLLEQFANAFPDSDWAKVARLKAAALRQRGGPDQNTPLSEDQIASLLSALGRYREAAAIFKRLGLDDRLKNTEAALQQGLAVWASGRTLLDTAETHYLNDEFSQGLSAIQSWISYLKSTLDKPSETRSLGAVNLSSAYAFRAESKFALNDYEGALEDMNMAHTYLEQARASDSDGRNTSNIAYREENQLKELIIMQFFHGDRTGACNLYNHKAAKNSVIAVYPILIQQSCSRQ